MSLLVTVAVGSAAAAAVPDIVDYMSSWRGMALINAIACAIFLTQIWVSLARQRIDLGSMPPKIRKSENPRAYWSVIFLFGVIAAWTGVAAALNFFRPE